MSQRSSLGEDSEKHNSFTQSCVTSARSLLHTPVHSVLPSTNSPVVSNIVLSPTVFSSAMMPVFNNLYSCGMISNPTLDTAVNLNVLQQPQSQSTSLQFELPPSFQSLPLISDHQKVNAMCAKMDSNTDSLKLNFFFSYSLLWFTASKHVRDLILEANSKLTKNETVTNPTPTNSSPEKTRQIPSLSPSIQPLCAVLQMTPGTESRNEINVVSGMCDAIEKVVEATSFGYASKLCLDLSEQLVSSCLLNKYQQFGISLITMNLCIT